ncbi:hypothetical protein [Kribbella sp. NPDC055071]
MNYHNYLLVAFSLQELRKLDPESDQHTDEQVRRKPRARRLFSRSRRATAPRTGPVRVD